MSNFGSDDETPGAEQACADALVDEMAKRLWRVAEERPFRFRDTSLSEARPYFFGRRHYAGLNEYEVAIIETGDPGVGVQGGEARFTRFFRAYLKRLGKARGLLFEGSEAHPFHMERYKAAALGLLEESGVEPFLGPHSVVFMFHQGYTFCYFDCGDPSAFDAPVYQYVEGEPGPKKIAEGFAQMLDAEVSLVEEVNLAEIESGGYFVTIKGGLVQRTYPAGGDGPRPLDTEDQYSGR